MRYCRLPIATYLIPLLLCASCFGQAWSGIVSTSRAINWSNAGLPATLPDGETTTNPWTPPTRTQCGSTISAGASASTIQTALNGCANGTYVLLGAGTFAFSNADLVLADMNEVTLRGSGGSATTITLSGLSYIAIGEPWGSGSGTLTACNGLSVTPANCQGVTNIQLSSVSGPSPLNDIIQLTQYNTGLSSTGTGSQSDNGGVFICDSATVCSSQSTEGVYEAQEQVLYVTAVSGAGPYNLTLSTPLYMPNWTSASGPTASWWTPAYVATGIGLEDMTIVTCVSSSTPGCTAANTAHTTGGNASAVFMQSYYASWMKGIRFIGTVASDQIYMQYGKNGLFANNYSFCDLALDGSDCGSMGIGKHSDDLLLNNVFEFGYPAEGTAGEEGNVFAYNYCASSNIAYPECRFFHHQAGSAMELSEGNDVSAVQDDDTWGTHDFNTYFRNYMRGDDPPYDSPGCCQIGADMDSFSRFSNLVGNVADNAQGAITTYLSTVSSPLDEYYEIGFASTTPPSDTLTQASAMLWGNCDAVNAACRFNSGEVPTSLSGNAAPYENSVPGSHNLPCSFFLVGYTSTTCTPHSSGGTGLSWWKVCTSWGTFPTSCSGTQLQPFPFAGPDVTSGPYVMGYAYDNPAAIAWKHLPVDTTYQQSFSITGSSWTGGTETLTVSGIPNVHHLMGLFQISGGNCATSGAGTSTGAEVAITASTSTTVSYALASNPGACTGTMLFPDVRQFDERVYESDSASSSPSPAAPQLFFTLQ